MADVWRYFAHEDDYNLDEPALAARLAAALAIPTVDGPSRDETDWEPFDRLEDLFRQEYPLVFSAGTVEHVDHSLLVTIPGTDPSLDPVMLMGHMDVVPVVAGTEGDWTHGAFSGFVDDEWIWGRGALDMTDQVVGDLEAVELLLDRGEAFRRTLILALGQDEEVAQTGARAMGRVLEERGTHLAFLLDEGDYVIQDLAPYGAPGAHGMPVGVAEKGYSDVILTVRSMGGHSSNPFGGTSLAILSEAIARIAGDERAIGLPEPVRQTLAAVAPWVSEEPLRSLLAPAEGQAWRQAVDANADAIARELAARRETFPLVQTTVAPTMIEGGSPQPNVMPQDMSATINFRILPGETVAQVVGRVRELVSDLPVEVEPVEAVSNDPSAVSRTDGWGFQVLREVAGRYFRDPQTGEAVPLVPSIQTGATDARMYEGVCDTCLRFSAFTADEDEKERGVHGTDERITRRAYAQGVRFTIALLEACLL